MIKNKKLCFVCRITGVLFILIFTSSCSITNYYFENSEMRTGLNLTTGKWILKEVVAPYEIKQKLSLLAKDDFSKILDSRFSLAKDVKEFLITPGIDLNKSPSELAKINKTTGYNYLIDIRAKVIKNEFNAVDFTNHKFKKDIKEKKILVELNVYDLDNQFLVYSKKAIAISKLKQDNDDINFSSSINTMILGAYKKIMKDINKKSVK